MYKCYFEGSNTSKIFTDKKVTNAAKCLYMYLINSEGKELDDELVKSDLNKSLPSITRAKRNLRESGYMKITRKSRTEYEVILK